MDRLNESSLRWIVSLLFMAGVAYASVSIAVKDVPILKDKSAAAEVRLAVLEAKLSTIEQGVNSINDKFDRYIRGPRNGR